MPYLRPDAKSQFTIEYDENNHPVRVHTIVVSTQHDEFVAPELGNMSYDEAVAKLLEAAGDYNATVTSFSLE